MLRTVVAVLLGLALITPAYAAQVAPSDEAAIRDVIERGNATQSRAIALRDPTEVGDHAVDAYQARLARTNRTLLASGVTTIELVNMDWGPINVDGPTASATTFETWRTSYATGPTEFARDRNVYALVRDDDGAWRVAGNEHPDGRARPAPVEPDGSDPGVDVPAGQSTSSNWAGYAARGGTFTSVSGTWTVPEIALDSPFGADAAWVGIGGLRSRDLIQAGTQQVVSGTGSVTYQAWVEKLPEVSQPVPLTVLPGHTVTISIDQQAPDTWLISSDQCHHRPDPATHRKLSVLAQLGRVDSGSAVRAATSAAALGSLARSTSAPHRPSKTARRSRLADLGARAISLIDDNRRALAVPSPLGLDGASFSVTRLLVLPSASRRHSTARACASRLSARASTTAGGPASRRSSALSANTEMIFEKIVDVDRRREARRATGGHDVARPGRVVADRFGVQLAQKHAAGVAHTRQPRPRIANRQAQVLAGEGVGQIHRFVQVARFDDAAAMRERLLDDGAAAASSATCSATSRSTASASAASGVISSDEASGSCSAWASRSAATQARIGRVVGHDQALGRSGQRLDADLAEDHAFGQHDEEIARARRSCRRAARSRCHRPGRRWPARRRRDSTASTPATCAAAEQDVRQRRRSAADGGEASTTSVTPATRAGIAAMSTLLG